MTWSANDSAAEAPNWAPSLVNLPANSVNSAKLFANVTADAIVSGQTVTVYGVSDTKMNYDEWELVGAVPGSALGTVVIPTANATSQYQVNGGTASVNAVINVATVVVSTANVEAAGNSYVTGDIVSVDDGEGTAATLVVTANGTGNVTAVEIRTRGSYANGADLPGANSTTTAVTGSGEGLLVNLTTGVGTLTIATNGTFTALPAAKEDNIATADGDQTGTGTKLNLVFRNKTANKTVQHAGWNLVKTGSGGRAGRIQSETLVTQSAMTGDAGKALFANN